MTSKFTDDDRGKDVVTHEGDRVGRINTVEENRATVERDEDASLTDKIKDMLGWNDDDEDHELRDEHVDRRDDDRIHLREH